MRHVGIKVLIPGFLSTIQDMGRWGYQDKGVSPSGVMDTHAAALANTLVSNPVSEGVIEAAMGGIQLAFEESTVIAVCGARTEILVDRRAVGMNTAVTVRRGQTLFIGPAAAGMWVYIAFAGGLDIAPVMKSASTNLSLHLGGMCGRKLKAGDQIGFRQPRSALPNQRLRHCPAPPLPAPNAVTPIRVILGPQDARFPPDVVSRLLSSQYIVTPESNRMGYRLSGSTGGLGSGYDIITDGITFGSIQVPPSGEPIVMMADHQTTGGYAKIAAVISEDLPVLAQCRPGSALRFADISVEDAQALIAARALYLERLRKTFERGELYLSFERRGALDTPQ